MARIKEAWLHFWAGWLTARAREVMLGEQARLTAALAAEKAENERLRSYLDGMQTALRYGRQVRIYNTPSKTDKPMKEEKHDENAL